MSSIIARGERRRVLLRYLLSDQTRDDVRKIDSPLNHLVQYPDSKRRMISGELSNGARNYFHT